MASFLDGTGLGHLIEKIKNTFIKKTDTVAASTLAIDSAPTANSTNLVTSGGVKTALDAKQNTIDSTHKLSADLISDGTTNKAYTATEKTKLAGIASGAEVNVQSDWNQTTTTADDYIKNKPTIPTVPTNVSAFTNDAGYTTNVGTITGITMNGSSKGTSGVVNLGTVVTDVSGKEDKMDIITVSATSLAPSVNKYYRFTADVGTLAVTLPTVTDTTKVASIVFYLTTGASPNVTFTSSHSVVYQDGFQLDASKTYEVNALFNGAAWVLMAAEINTGS